MQNSIDDLRIRSLRPLVQPNELLESLPLPETSAVFINHARQTIADILTGKDKRLLLIVGPCSIHDPIMALEYAELLRQAAMRFSKKLFIVMRVYFEKPRTNVGWKGLISDPHLNGTFDINYGLRSARNLLLQLAKKGLPAATEFLDTIIPQYLSDLISWSAIGARTTQSQIHRELASGLSMPVGFKNSTDGNIKIAIDAVHTASHPHHFLGISKSGSPSIISTKGNPNCHVILRGGSDGPNYQADIIAKTIAALKEANSISRIMIDCSHGNSMKDHERQKTAVDAIGHQLNNPGICGLMLESSLIAGKQSLESNKSLVYGQSITDACLSWNETLEILEKLNNLLALQANRDNP